MTRQARCTRTTGETDVTVSLNLDGGGQAHIQTGVGFFDHMLDALARHSLIDMEISCQGDLMTGAHHTMEDVGLVLGRALKEALGDKRSISRYGSMAVPMDEALAQCHLDLSGRAYLVFEGAFDLPLIGNYETEATQDFFRALSQEAGMTLHLTCPRGVNTHHMIEAMFKAFARALRQAVTLDPRVQGIPSTKDVL